MFNLKTKTMKTLTPKLLMLFVLVLFPFAISAQEVYEDNFDASHDYLNAGVEGTIWDALIINDTLIGSDAPAAVAYRIDTDSVPGALTIRSTNTYWGGDWTNGILLCKIVPADVNFIAQVKIVGGDLSSWEGPIAYMCPGLMARNPDRAAGDFVDVFAFDRAEWNAVHLFESWDDDVEDETPTAEAGSVYDNPWIRLERSGNEFITYYGPDGETWTEIGRVTRDDLAGIDLQVGISHSMNTDLVGTALYDNFKLIVNPGSKVNDTKMNELASVYYRPANRSIVIDAKNQKIDCVKIYTLDGRMINELRNVGTRAEVNIIRNGLFIVAVESNGKSASKKVAVY